MADQSKEDERWEKVHESIDLLYAKMEAQERMQQQMAAQMDLTLRALAQSSQEQLKLS
jgi:hypothetical protein